MRNSVLLLVAAVLIVVGISLVLVPHLFPDQFQAVEQSASSATLQTGASTSSAAPAAQHDVTAAPTSEATLRSPDQTDAERTALAVTTAYARPSSGTPEQKWCNQVAAWLTLAAEDDYSGVSPTKIPYRSVTGPPALRYVGATTARVSVPTDQGVWTVDLVRDPSKPYGWAVTRLGAAAAGE